MKTPTRSLFFKKREIILMVLFILILVVGVLSIHQYTQIQDSSAATPTVTVSGKLNIFVVDSQVNSNTSTEYLIRKTNGDRIVVSSGQSKLKNLPPFSDVTLEGKFKVNGNFAVNTVSKSTPPQTRNKASTSIGNKKVRILLANFDDSTPNHTKEYYRNSILSSNNPTSVNSFMKKSSRGAMTIDENNSVIHDWVNLTVPDNLPCELNTMYNNILPAMDNYYTSLGIDLLDSSFLSVFYIIKYECPFGAWGHLGNGTTTPLHIYASDYTHPYITPQPYSPSHYLSHELGHNLGLHHAQALECGNTSYNDFSLCEIQTNQHPFSTMGSRGYREFNASERYRLGWLKQSEYRNVTTNGSFQIVPLSTDDTSLKVIIVKQRVEDANRAYFIHLRTPQGAFDNYPSEPTSPKPYGVAIELGYINPTLSANKYSFINDTTPQSIEGHLDINDSLLTLAGSKYRDRKNDIEVTLNSLASTSANVTISGITADPRCSQIPDTGTCRAKFTKYFFNQTSLNCESFIWGGCEGLVPFHSLQDCNNSCS